MNKFTSICYENIIYVMYNCNNIIKEFIVGKKLLNNDNILLNESIETTMKKTC